MRNFWRVLTVFLLFSIFYFSCAQSDNSTTGDNTVKKAEDNTRKKIGSVAFTNGDIIDVVVTKPDIPDPGIVFINVHDNENAAAEAARQVVTKTGGKLVELIHYDNYGDSSDYRYRYIQLQPKVDMNRMFRTNNEDIFKREIQLFEKLVTTVRKELEGAELIVAVHNNASPTYSIDKCFEVRKEEIAERYDVPQENPGKERVPGTLGASEFILVTEKSLFDKLKGGKYNVVLQNNEKVTEDGSLSVYSALVLKIPYVNVEVCNYGGKYKDEKDENAIVATQVEMINEVVRAFNSQQK